MSLRVHAGEMQEGPVGEIGAQRYLIGTAFGDKCVPIQGSHYLSEADDAVRQVVITVPGMLRNQGPQRIREKIYPGCYDTAVTLARAAKRPTAAFAIQFLTPSDSRDKAFLLWDVEGWKGGYPSLGGEGISTFTVLDRLVEHTKNIYPKLERLVMFGNSAGGQFVSRYCAYGNARSILGDDIEMAIGSSNGSSYPYLDDWRGKTVEQVKRFSMAHNLGIDCEPAEIAKIRRWRFGPEIPPGEAGLSFLRDVSPDVALAGLLDTNLYLLAGEQDVRIDVPGVQQDLASMVQGFSVLDFDHLGNRRDGVDCHALDYGRYARARVRLLVERSSRSPWHSPKRPPHHRRGWTRCRQNHRRSGSARGLARRACLRAPKPTSS